MSGNGIAPGSIASIFGVNLAVGTLEAETIPFPTQLGSTTVTAGGVLAPLLYVCPGQVTFQMPFSASGAIPVTVSTSAGISNPYMIAVADYFGVFTRGPGGCGDAAALHITSDRVISVTSQSQSVSPARIRANTAFAPRHLRLQGSN